MLITRKCEILAARVSMTDDESDREAETEREQDITHDTHSSPFSESLWIAASIKSSVRLQSRNMSWPRVSECVCVCVDLSELWIMLNIY